MVRGVRGSPWSPNLLFLTSVPTGSGPSWSGHPEARCAVGSWVEPGGTRGQDSSRWLPRWSWEHRSKSGMGRNATCALAIPRARPQSPGAPGGYGKSQSSRPFPKPYFGYIQATVSFPSWGSWD